MILTLNIIIITFAFLAEATFGFGGGLLSIPLLSTIIDPLDAINTVAIFQLLIGVLIFTSLKNIDWKLVKPVVIGAILGTVIGFQLINQLNEVAIRWFLVIFIASFLYKTKFHPNISFSKASISGGLTSGIFFGLFQGSIGLGGPNLVIYFKELSTSKESFRAHAILLLSIANVIRMLLAFSHTNINENVSQLFFYTLPFFIIAICSGSYLSNKISQEVFNKLVEILLFISLIALIFKNNI